MGCSSSKQSDAYMYNVYAEAANKAKAQATENPIILPNLLDKEDPQMKQKSTGERTRGPTRLSVHGSSISAASKSLERQATVDTMSPDETAVEDVLEKLGSGIFLGSDLDLNGKADGFTEKMKKTHVVGAMPPLPNTLAATCRKGVKGSPSPNQDSYCVCKTPEFSVYGVFDGHGVDGHKVSAFVQDQMIGMILQDERLANLEQRSAVLNDAFVQVHNLVVDAWTKRSAFDAALAGCTATVVIHDHSANVLHIAHVGDSNCCIGKTKDQAPASDTFQALEAEKLTEEHKPNQPAEKKRIEAGGGMVVFDGYVNHRVFAKGQKYPGMAMSRAIGDVLGHREAGITAMPTVTVRKLQQHDKVLLLASDGVWEFLKPQQVCKAMSKFEPQRADECAQEVVTMAWNSWVKEETIVDDITAIVVYLGSS